MDRKDIKSSKKVFIMADLQAGSVMAKYFIETGITLNFVRGQELTTYAYEMSRLLKDKIMPINFIHITKAEFNENSRTYQSFPRLIPFYEQETIKLVAQKIFLSIKPLIHQVLPRN